MSLFSRPGFASGDRIEVAGASVRLKVDARARRVSLRVDTRRREVIATAPSQTRLKEAAAFAQARAAWIASQISALPAPPSLGPGQVITVLGEPHRLVQAGTRASAGFAVDGDGAKVLAAYGAGEAFARSALTQLKRRALQAFSERTAAYAQRLGQPMPSVAIGDARSRWGSCRPAHVPRLGPPKAAAIRYSWRLVLAPYEIADYVCAHECAHLIEANHGPQFWAIVSEIYGSQTGPRAWLRRHGPRLHAFGREG